MSNVDILTIGDTTIDLYMRIGLDSNLPNIGEDSSPKICFYHGSKIPVEQFSTSIAGNSLNVAFGTTHLGLRTSIYTELGDDPNADKIIGGLKEIGVDTTFCVKNKGTPTNVNSVIVYGGDRTIFSYHEKRNYNIQVWEKPKWIYYTSMGYGFESFQMDLIEYIEKNNDIGVVFNPGTIQMKAGLESFRNFLKVTDIFFVNKEEAQILVGQAEPLDKLHVNLRKLGPSLTVITDGKNGASAFDGENLVTVNAYSDERPVIDKTGAGDAFASGFVAAIFYGKKLKEALAWGVVNAGNSIKEIGSINGLCTKEEIEEIVKKLI